MGAAFLRAINVAGRRVTNAHLCSCFEGMGFGQVSAFLASGNVLFDLSSRSSDEVESVIEEGLEQCLGYEVPTFVRTAREIFAMSSSQPFSDTDLARTSGNMQVVLLSTMPDQPRRNAALDRAPEEDLLAIVGRDMFWLPKGNISDSELDVKGLESILGSMTIRTHRTMVRLAAKLG